MNTYRDILIYEFDGNYFVIQRAQQGKTPTPTPHQRPSENAKMFAKLPVDCFPEEIGSAAIGALDSFDSNPPKYDPWELAGLNKQLSKWLGARSFAAVTKNSRLVQLVRDESAISIIPFDNHNIDPWYGPMEREAEEVDKDISPPKLGLRISAAFTKATYNPKSTNPLKQKTLK